MHRKSRTHQVLGLDSFNLLQEGKAEWHSIEHTVDSTCIRLTHKVYYALARGEILVKEILRKMVRLCSVTIRPTREGARKEK